MDHPFYWPSSLNRRPITTAIRSQFSRAATPAQRDLSVRSDRAFPEGLPISAPQYFLPMDMTKSIHAFHWIVHRKMTNKVRRSRRPMLLPSLLFNKRDELDLVGTPSGRRMNITDFTVTAVVREARVLRGRSRYPVSHKVPILRERDAIIIPVFFSSQLEIGLSLAKRDCR